MILRRLQVFHLAFEFASFALIVGCGGSGARKARE
jgi:hypothetical protein